MSNYCPEWIFGSCCAKTAFDFLNTNNSIIAVSKKFSNELTLRYDEVKFEEIVDVAEKMLQFLSEIKAGEEAVIILSDYIYYRVNYNANGSIRKVNSLFSSAFDGEKEKSYNSQQTTKVFKATTFSHRNNTLEKATPGWVVNDKEDIDWLGELFEKPTDFSDI